MGSHMGGWDDLHRRLSKSRKKITVLPKTEDVLEIEIEVLYFLIYNYCKKNL